MSYKYTLECYLKKNDLPIQYETTSIGRSTNPAKFVSSIEIKGNIFGSMCECCFLAATVFPSADNNDNNYILYLGTFSREETLFKCVYRVHTLV